MTFASDKAYGRQGGRIGRHAKAEEEAAAIHRDRIAAIKRNGPHPHHKDEPEWPQASIDRWRIIAREARAKQDRGEPLTVTDKRAIEVDRAAKGVRR